MGQMLRRGCRLGIQAQSDGPMDFASAVDGDSGAEVSRGKFAMRSQLRPRICARLRAALETPLLL
eukprot:8444278-Pyramimonas_sp.AAC.1